MTRFYRGLKHLQIEYNCLDKQYFKYEGFRMSKLDLFNKVEQDKEVIVDGDNNNVKEQKMDDKEFDDAMDGLIECEICGYYFYPNCNEKLCETCRVDFGDLDERTW